MKQLLQVQAKTHQAEYAWHKYWSRKPANVISAYLGEFVTPGSTVVDPFCGSGVVLREAQKLGATAIGFDVNPIAIEISNFLLDPVDCDQYADLASKMLNDLENDFADLYETCDGRKIRFLTHAVVTACSKCNTEIAYDADNKESNQKRCDFCGARLSFGLSNLTRTNITEVVLQDGSVICDPSELNYQLQLSNRNSSNTSSHFTTQFVTNARTLTSNQLTTSDFFTPRNFSILSEFATRVHREKDPLLKRALMLTLTASCAQASRLIAHRGGLRTGGQAWTVPGFWVPPVHIESNPFLHLAARVKKIAAALTARGRQSSSDSQARAQLYTAQQGLSDMFDRQQKADFVFIDPPYGDSVAFTEFSAIWNSFLNADVDYASDISISNRLENPVGPPEYRSGMVDVFNSVPRILSDSGVVLITFNNNDLESWRSLMGAAQKSGLRVASVSYQDPAVVSSKAQFSVHGSYVGDFYVVMKPALTALEPLDSNLTDLTSLLTRAVECRGGKIPVRLLHRFGIEFWLRRNIDAFEIGRLDQITQSIFLMKGNTVSLKQQPTSTPLRIIALEKLRDTFGDRVDDQSLAQLANSLSDFGTPSLKELRVLISLDDEDGEDSSETISQLAFCLN